MLFGVTWVSPQEKKILQRAVPWIWDISMCWSLSGWYLPFEQGHLLLQCNPSVSASQVYQQKRMNFYIKLKWKDTGIKIVECFVDHSKRWLKSWCRLKEIQPPKTLPPSHSTL